jgi:predicted S18 family serine protease
MPHPKHHQEGGSMQESHKGIIKIAVLVGLFMGVFVFGYLVGPLLFPELEEEQKQTTNIHVADERIVINKVVAVDAQGKGVSANLDTYIKDGRGLVLVNINNVLADIDTQQSARTAVKVASEFTNIDTSTLDIIFNIDTNAELVSGKSAGSTMAMAVINALVKTPARDDVIMTGEILEDGTIGKVQGIPAKAQAAKDANATLFLVPKGGAKSAVEFARNKECGWLDDYKYCTIEYVPEQSDLSSIVGIEVKEVKDIADAVTVYFGYEGIAI